MQNIQNNIPSKEIIIDTKISNLPSFSVSSPKTGIVKLSESKILKLQKVNNNL
ncbi:MAG: hypothetical protein AB8B67_04640 [Rickettsiaceae bacterium]